ncbi:MAG: hypothetical protein DCC75_03920 [Proteobacteria bacterium]|nr:MAG: hypothetical protein DCC75_03920 [Pseudomonadota bacterium]
MRIFLPVFQALLEANVRFLLAGGLATVLHGHQRLTGDIILFTELPLPFDALYAEKSVKPLGGLQIPVVSIRHLIEMKRSAGRSQDLDDIKALEILKSDE